MLFQYLEDGNLEKIQEFLDENPGFDIDAFDEKYASWPIEWAIEFCDNLAIITLLLEKGVNPNNGGEYPPLWLAAAKGRIDLVNAFLKYGADPSISSSEDDSTPLMIASKKGYFEIAKVLLEAGANLRAEDECGNTALEIALQQGHQELSDYLLAARTQNEA